MGTKMRNKFEDEETQRSRTGPGQNSRERQSGTADKWQAATDDRQEAREVKQAASAASDSMRERQQHARQAVARRGRARAQGARGEERARGSESAQFCTQQGAFDVKQQPET